MGCEFGEFADSGDSGDGSAELKLAFAISGL
jgi:hypothetical protein